jgi:hypothetical protein
MNLSFVLCVSLQSANVFLEIEGQIEKRHKNLLTNDERKHSWKFDQDVCLFKKNRKQLRVGVSRTFILWFSVTPDIKTVFI